MKEAAIIAASHNAAGTAARILMTMDRKIW
jgi:hypothetical protein